VFVRVATWEGVGQLDDGAFGRAARDTAQVGLSHRGYVRLSKDPPGSSGPPGTEGVE